MKIKDLAALAANCRRMTLLNTRAEDGSIVRQHLALNALAVYPLDGMQAITPDTLLTIADVGEEARELYDVAQADMAGISAEAAEDQLPTDEMAQLGKITLKLRGVELVTVEPEGGGEVLFLHTRLLKPIKDRDQPGLVVRRIGKDGQRVIVALEGWKNVGVFAPAELWATGDEAVELQRIARAANALAILNAQREQDAR